MYQREFEPVNPMLISVIRDAVLGVMPPRGGGLLRLCKVISTLMVEE
jgi:hypothetical protein